MWSACFGRFDERLERVGGGFVFADEFVDLHVGVVAGADERAGLDDFPADVEADVAVPVELLGGDPAVDGEVVARGLEVLADGEDVGLGLVVDLFHEVDDLGVFLADADHDAGLRDQTRILADAQQLDGAVELGLGADGGVAAADGFEVVVEDFGACVDDELEGVPVALEVGDEDLDGHVGAECV